MTDTPPQWALDIAHELLPTIYMQRVTWRAEEVLARALAEARAAGYRAGQEAIADRALDLVRDSIEYAFNDSTEEEISATDVIGCVEDAFAELRAAIPIEDEKTP